MRPAHRFPSPDPKVFRHGPLGIHVQGTCIICGDTFRQPSNGRPRKLCRKRKCALARQSQLQRSYRAKPAPEPEWTAADREEAILVWGDLCAICRCGTIETGWRFRGGILPICWDCRDASLTPRAQAWLDACRHNIPLPKPLFPRAEVGR